jgi:hypothetical protein
MPGERRRGDLRALSRRRLPCYGYFFFQITASHTHVAADEDVVVVRRVAADVALYILNAEFGALS